MSNTYTLVDEQRAVGDDFVFASEPTGDLLYDNTGSVTRTRWTGTSGRL